MGVSKSWSLIGNRGRHRSLLVRPGEYHGHTESADDVARPGSVVLREEQRALEILHRQKKLTDKKRGGAEGRLTNQRALHFQRSDASLRDYRVLETCPLRQPADQTQYERSVKGEHLKVGNSHVKIPLAGMKDAQA